MIEHLRRARPGSGYRRKKAKKVRSDLPNQMEMDVHEWKTMRKKGLTEMRPYVEGEDLTGISVQPDYTPKNGDFVARDPTNPKDLWLISAEYARDNYEPAD